MRFRLLASSLLLGLTTCARPEPVTADPPIGALTDVLTRQNPNPVSLSPSGAFVLLKSMHATDFELEVRRRRRDVIVARDRAGDTQLAPTWRFDDGALAFLSDHDGDQRYRPFVLDIASGKRRAIEPSPSTEATALRWEPRGTRLAYLVAERGTRERRVAVVDTAAAAPAPVIALDGLFEHAGFVWSPDGGFIAGVSHAIPSTVVIGNSRAVVLLSYVQAAAAPHDQARRPRVVAYHGENDIALAPAEARRLLVDRFGVDALERFVELAREGHTFHRVESWARIYAALLARLNGTS